MQGRIEFKCGSGGFLTKENDMMTRMRFLSLAATLVAFCPVGLAFAQTGSGVLPDEILDFKSGNAYDECGLYGECGEYAWKIEKIEGESLDGDYDTSVADAENEEPIPDGPTITISNVSTDPESGDQYIFDWSISEGYEVCAVIVKGSTSGLVYKYDGAVMDTNLSSPINPNNPNKSLAGISHISFCFRKVSLVCYEDETAWAAGTRYSTKGNWATYTQYVAGRTVDLLAGQSLLAGTVTFSAVVDKMVTITIELNEGFSFQDTLETVKVQGYSVAPSGNPEPGQFAYKLDASGTTAEITVRASNFYGIHVDVRRVVPCVE